MAKALKVFQKTVTTKGTAVALSSTSLVVRSCVIKGLWANTGYIHIGESDVDYSTQKGFEVAAGEPFSPTGMVNAQSVDVNEQTVDLNNVYIDSTVDGEGVCVSYIPL